MRLGTGGEVGPLGHCSMARNVGSLQQEPSVLGRGDGAGVWGHQVVAAGPRALSHNGVVGYVGLWLWGAGSQPLPATSSQVGPCTSSKMACSPIPSGEKH